MATNPTKNTVVLPPKAHVRTAEDIGLLTSVNVRIMEGGETTVVGVLVGPDAYEAELAIGRGSEGLRGRGTREACRDYAPQASCCPYRSQATWSGRWTWRDVEGPL